MRVNIYSQELELNDDPVLVSKRGTNHEGIEEVFYGVRFYLRSPASLHFTEYDDDRSAITFWLPKGQQKKVRLSDIFVAAGDLVITHTLESKAN